MILMLETMIEAPFHTGQVIKVTFFHSEKNTYDPLREIVRMMAYNATRRRSLSVSI